MVNRKYRTKKEKDTAVKSWKKRGYRATVTKTPTGFIVSYRKLN